MRSERPPDGHARRAQRTANEILLAAHDVLAEAGYAGATVEQIAERAQVAPASVYNHFGSKAGVAQALAERALSVHAEHVERAWGLDASPLERLIAAAGATLSFSRQEPVLFHTLALSYLGPPGLFPPGTIAAERISGRIDAQLDRLSANLQAAIDAGELRPLDAPATARFVLGAWTGVITMAMQRGADAEAGPALAAGLRALIEGAATPASLTRQRRLRTRYARAVQRAGLGAEDRAAA